MIRWLRVVLPPWWLVGGLMLGWVPFAVLSAVWSAVVGGPPDPELRTVCVATLAMGSAVYGLSRALRFHPAYPQRAGYAAWLYLTPWTPARPLPDGPVLLVPQDAFVLAALVGPAWLAFGPEAWPILPAFAFAYLAGLAWLLYRTRERGAAYLVWFGLGGLMLFGHVPVAAVGCAAAAYAVGAVAFRRSLWGFPWPGEPDDLARMRAASARGLGWPFDRVTPVFAPSRLRAWEGPVRGLLTAWLLYAVGFQLDRTEPDTQGERASVLVQGAPLVVAYLALARLLAYVYGHLPPISLLGRLGTGRLVIPRYDVVFVAPLLAVAGAAACLFALTEFGLPGYAAGAVGAGLAVGVLYTVGPDRVRWQLTAPCRLVPFRRQPPRLQNQSISPLTLGEL